MEAQGAPHLSAGAVARAPRRRRPQAAPDPYLQANERAALRSATYPSYATAGKRAAA